MGSLPLRHLFVPTGTPAPFQVTFHPYDGFLLKHGRAPPTSFDLDLLVYKDDNLYCGNEKLTHQKRLSKASKVPVYELYLHNKPVAVVKYVRGASVDPYEAPSHEIGVVDILRKCRIGAVNVIDARIPLDFRAYVQKLKLIQKYTLDDGGLCDEYTTQATEIMKRMPYDAIPVVMEYYQGDLTTLINHLTSIDICRIGIELGKVLISLMSHGLYYTDMKPENVLWKFSTFESITVRLADLGSIYQKGRWAAQTYPYPNANFVTGDVHTLSLASERVVVWGLGMVLVMLFDSHVYRNAKAWMSWSELNGKNRGLFSAYISRKPNIPSCIKRLVVNDQYSRLKVFLSDLLSSIGQHTHTR